MIKTKVYEDDDIVAYNIVEFVPCNNGKYEPTYEPDGKIERSNFIVNGQVRLDYYTKFSKAKPDTHTEPPAPPKDDVEDVKCFHIAPTDIESIRMNNYGDVEVVMNGRVTVTFPDYASMIRAFVNHTK